MDFPTGSVKGTAPLSSASEHLVSVVEPYHRRRVLMAFFVFSDFRKVLVATVLTTDMSRHFPFVARLQDMRADFVTNLDQSPAKVEEQRLLLCSALMKCGDISNPVRARYPFRSSVPI